MPNKRNNRKPKTHNQSSTTPHTHSVRITRVEKNLTGQQRLARALIALARAQIKAAEKG